MRVCEQEEGDRERIYLLIQQSREGETEKESDQRTQLGWEINKRIVGPAKKRRGLRYSLNNCNFILEQSLFRDFQHVIVG